MPKRSVFKKSKAHLFLILNSIDQLFEAVQNGERCEIGDRVDEHNGVRTVDVVFDCLRIVEAGVVDSAGVIEPDLLFAAALIVHVG